MLLDFSKTRYACLDSRPKFIPLVCRNSLKLNDLRVRNFVRGRVQFVFGRMIIRQMDGEVIYFVLYLVYIIYLFIFNLSRKLGITNERNESNFSNNIIAQGVRTILTNYVFIELTDFN